MTIAPSPADLSHRLEVRRSSLAFHGGGERLHQDELRDRLEQHGVRTTRTILLADEHAESTDFVHLWNLQDPREALAASDWARSCELPTVVTPLHADRTVLFEGSGLARAMLASDAQNLTRTIESYADGTLLEDVREGLIDESGEPPTWEAMRQRVLSCAQLVHCLSETEAQKIVDTYGIERSRIVVSGVAPTFADRSECLVDGDYVLVPASRLEPLKNQLGVILAAHRASVPFVITGSAHDKRYASLCQALAPTNVRFVGFQESPDLARLMEHARVVLHPSFLECASLAVVDAASVGANLITSATSNEREYYGELPRYVDPRSPLEIAERVTEAWNAAPSEAARRSELRACVAARTWDDCAITLANAMNETLRPATV